MPFVMSVLLFCSVADGDLITIFDSSDLTFAIQCSRILKITLFGKHVDHHREHLIGVGVGQNFFNEVVVDLFFMVCFTLCYNWHG